jgi:hypothetical protein
MNAAQETKIALIGPWRIRHGLGLGFATFACKGALSPIEIGGMAAPAAKAIDQDQSGVFQLGKPCGHLALHFAPNGLRGILLKDFSMYRNVWRHAGSRNDRGHGKNRE